MARLQMHGASPTAVLALHPTATAAGTAGCPAPRLRPPGERSYMLSMMALAKPLVETSVAPSVWRAKS